MRVMVLPDPKQVKRNDVSSQEVPLSGRSDSEPRGEAGLEGQKEMEVGGDRKINQLQR